MKILALDSSGLVASVAIVEEDAVVAEYTVNYKKTHSQTLLPMLDEIKRMTELDLNSIDAIAVASGPGSFTGLRIGAATAKGLGLALDIPIIPVPTVDSLAYNLYGSQKLICPLMDARRNQVYTGLYTFEDDALITIEPQCAVDISEIMGKINTLGKEVIFWETVFAYIGNQLQSWQRFNMILLLPAATGSVQHVWQRWEKSFINRESCKMRHSMRRII